MKGDKLVNFTSFDEVEVINIYYFYFWFFCLIFCIEKLTHIVITKINRIQKQTTTNKKSNKTITSVKAKANNVIINQEYMNNIINCTNIDNCKVIQKRKQKHGL